MPGRGQRAAAMASTSQQQSKRKRENSLEGENVESNSWGTTEVEEEEFTYLWTIKNYSTFCQNAEPFSPVFSGGAKSQHKWQLEINPNELSEDEDGVGQEYLGVYLHLVEFGDGIKNSDKRILKARYAFSVKDDQPEKDCANASEFKKLSTWGWHNVILISELTAPGCPFLANDTLKVQCRVWIEGDVLEITGNGRLLYGCKEERIVKQTKQLASDFAASLESMEFSDVVLTTPNETFKAHKFVLASRSKVFAAMFANNMLEASNNAVEISDFDEKVVKAMIEYIYSGEVKSLPANAPDLLQIAEKYDLPLLKEECELEMANNLSVNTACEVLILANMYSPTVLKPRVIEFINRNREEVRRSSAYQKVIATNPTTAIFLDLYFSQ